MPAGPAPGTPSPSDPLAELARLIGQSDPFSEYGRDGARAAAAPMVAPQGQPPMPDAQPFNPPNFARQSFGGPPLAAGPDLYQVEGEDPRYAEPHAGTHDDDAYRPSNAQLGPEEQDFYEDAPPSRRRLGVMVIAGVFALAVIGTAGAFGYRALFGPTGPSAPPPVIKAESAPSKIVPASNRDTQSSKQITDRVDARGQSEKLVSREEQPVEIKDKPAGVMFPPGQDQSGSSSPATGSGVVSPDAKRVRTIAIRPDQATIADSMPTVAPPAAQTPSPRVANVPPVRPAAPAAPPQQQPPSRVVSSASPAVDPEPVTPPARRQPVTRVTPTVAQHQAAAPANAPLSLSPDAPAPARVAPARAATPAVRTAAVAPTQVAPAAASGGGYAVQVSSHPSEAEAQAAFRGLQGKYPGQLGGKQPLIRKVDLGAKGIYYRVMVGPFATGNEASTLCSSLKAAGGQCIIQRN
ncbi:MAG: SPOR domain-containing protein [Rhizobiales bacterium]|nr:SPOR domain-containing protein [Hyphomicrobiales bacterium]